MLRYGPMLCPISAQKEFDLLKRPDFWARHVLSIVNTVVYTPSGSVCMIFIRHSLTLKNEEDFYDGL